MKNKQTKEQLVIELAKLQQAYAELVESDKKRRIEFAKSFGWVMTSSFSSWGDKINGYNAKETTWTEIFIEVGKLLANRDFRNQQEEIATLRDIINKLQAKEAKEDKQS